MAKRKGRAERRERRQRAAKARERGLPEGAPISEPARVRQPAGDVTELALKSGRGKRGSGGRRAPVDDRGFPMLGKVAIGAALALALVYGLSQLRKLDAPRVDENSGESQAPGDVGSKAQVPAAEAPDEDAAAAAVDDEEAAEVDDEAALDDESLTSSMNERDAELAGDEAPLPAPSVPSAPSVGSVPTVAPAPARSKAPVPRPSETVPSPAPQSPAPQSPAPPTE